MDKWARRLLVVEDDSLVAALLEDMLTKNGFEIRTATNLADAMSALETFDPDGALLDINLGAGPSGLTLGHLLHRDRPEIGLVFLTRLPALKGSGQLDFNLPEGSTFISKSRVTDIGYLTKVIDDALHGRNSVLETNQANEPLSKLTRVQVEILRMVALGLTNSAIAARRNTKERTVEQRLQTIYEQLGIPVNGEVNPRVEAVRIYIDSVGLPAE